VGVGWGSKYASTIAGMNGVRLSAICRHGKDRPDWTPDECLFYTNWGDFLSEAQENCDGIIIATPPHLHVSMAIDAIRKGIPVLIEKPVCEFRTDYDDLIRASVRRKVPFLVGYTHVFSHAFQKLKTLVIPPVVAIQSWGLNTGPFRTYSSLFDYGPHDLSMCLDLMRCMPTIGKVRRTSMIEGEIFDLALRFSSNPMSGPEGTLALIRVGNGSRNKRRRFQVFSKSGLLEYDDTKSDKLTLDGKVIDIPKIAPLQCVIESFMDMINGGFNPAWEPHLSASVTSLLEEAYETILE
jgi:predicted dehydrogenase